MISKIKFNIIDPLLHEDDTTVAHMIIDKTHIIEFFQIIGVKDTRVILNKNVRRYYISQDSDEYAINFYYKTYATGYKKSFTCDLSVLRNKYGVIYKEDV